MMGQAGGRQRQGTVTCQGRKSEVASKGRRSYLRSPARLSQTGLHITPPQGERQLRGWHPGACSVLGPPRGCDKCGGRVSGSHGTFFAVAGTPLARALLEEATPQQSHLLGPCLVPVSLWGHVAIWLDLSVSCVSLLAERVRHPGVFPCSLTHPR